MVLKLNIIVLIFSIIISAISIYLSLAGQVSKGKQGIKGEIGKQGPSQEISDMEKVYVDNYISDNFNQSFDVYSNLSESIIQTDGKVLAKNVKESEVSYELKASCGKLGCEDVTQKLLVIGDNTCEAVSNPLCTVDDNCTQSSDCGDGTCVCSKFESSGICEEGNCRANECSAGSPCEEGEQCIAGKCFSENGVCGEAWWYLPYASKNSEVKGFKNKAPKLCTNTQMCYARVDTTLTPKCAVCTEDTHCPEGEVCYTQDNSVCYDWINQAHNYHNNIYSFCAAPQCQQNSDCDGSLGEGLYEDSKKNKPDSEYCVDPGKPCGCAICNPDKKKRIKEIGYLERSPGCSKIEEPGGNFEGGNYCINNKCKIGECQDEEDCGENMECSTDLGPSTVCIRGDIDQSKTWSACFKSDPDCKNIYNMAALDSKQGEEFSKLFEELDYVCYGDGTGEGDICAGPGYGQASQNAAMLFSGLNQTYINNLFIRDDSPCGKCHTQPFP